MSSVAPVVTAAESSITVIEGSTATLTCLATGDPVPDQTWSRNGTQLTSGGRYQISSDGRVLTVQQVNEEQDEGVLTCHASNDAGSDSADIALSVLSKYCSRVLLMLFSLSFSPAPFFPSPPLSLSLSLSYSLSHTLPPPLSLSLSLTHSHTHSPPPSLSLSYSLSHTLPPPPLSLSLSHRIS